MASKRVLVIGKSGQLARCLADEVKTWRTLSVEFYSSTSCDLLQPDRVFDCLHPFDDAPPDVIVNTAAFHDLRACERDFDAAFRVNALGVANILAAMPQGCHLYQISTDYVFDGHGRPEDHLVPPPIGYVDPLLPRPFSPSDRCCPLNNYGRTKRAGELIALESGRATVIRTASLFSKYGSSGKGGSNFLLGMLKKATTEAWGLAGYELGDGKVELTEVSRIREPISVDSDLVMSPTYTPWLARSILHMIDNREQPPLAHIVCDGPPVSWFDFAKAIFEVGGFAEALSRLVPKQSDPWPPRPKFSALENSLPYLRVGEWRTALEHFFEYEWPRIKEAI